VPDVFSHLGFSACSSQGNEHIRVSKFYKEGNEGKFVTFLYEDTRTLYEGFRRGAKESSKSLISRESSLGSRIVCKQ